MPRHNLYWVTCDTCHVRFLTVTKTTKTHRKCLPLKGFLRDYKFEFEARALAYAAYVTGKQEEQEDRIVREYSEQSREEAQSGGECEHPI